MAVNLSPVGGAAAQFFTNDGVPLAGGKLYTYLAGTTTPTPTYTTSAGTIYHTNPIILDSAGRVPSGGEIWITDTLSYKFVLKDSTDVLIATYDNIVGINSNYLSYTSQQYLATATSGQTVFNLPFSYTPGTNSISVYVDGVNQYGPGAQYAYVETDADTVTFNVGLHLGAEVKFTATQQQSAGVVDASQVTYDPPFAGSVATNVEAKLEQYVSVKDFGATGDGATDDTAAIQAAIDSLPVRGGGVYFPSGIYVVGSAVTINKPGVYFGDGYATNIRTTSATANTFTIDAEQVHVKNMRFTTSVAKTAGHFVNAIAAADRFTLSNFSMYSPFIGVRVGPNTNTIIENGSIFNAEASTGIAVFIEGATNATVRSIVATNTTKILAGVQVAEATNLVLDDIEADDCEYGLHLTAATGVTVSFVSVANSFFDDCTRGVFADAAGGNITRVTLDTCQVSNSSDAGVRMVTSSSGAISGVRLDKCQIFSNAANGVTLADSGVGNVRITNCNITDNTLSGVIADADVTSFSIQNCRIGTNGAYGVRVLSGTGNQIIVTGNDLRGNTTANLSILATGDNIIIDNNLGANEAWTGYTPVVTAGTGTFTTLGTVVGRYQKIGKQLFITLSIPITTNGSAASNILVGLPSGMTAASDCVIVGKEVTAGLQLQGVIFAAGTTFSVVRYDNSYPGNDGYRLVLTGVIEVN